MYVYCTLNVFKRMDGRQSWKNETYYINPDHLCIHFSLIKSSCLSKSNLPSIMMAKSKRQFRIMILLTQIACLSLLIVKLVDLSNGSMQEVY